MAKPTYKFKNVKAGKDPASGRQLYQQVMLVDYDGKTSTYKTAKHTSRERLRDDVNRMIATVNASFKEGPVTIKQNYGDAEFRTVGSEDVASTVREGGQLKAPETYQLSRNLGGMENIQTYSQRGIRKGPSVTRPFANMLDPNYDPVTDTIKPPAETDTGDQGATPAARTMSAPATGATQATQPVASAMRATAPVASAMRAPAIASTQGVGQTGLLSGSEARQSRSLLGRLRRSV